MRKLIIGIGLMFSFVAFADQPPKVNPEEIRAGLHDKLKDPYSAQFKNVRFSNGSGGVWVVCGEVNSKNSYGGYAGYTKFRGIAMQEEDKVVYHIVDVGEFACK